ncbi:hypothetical protein C0991_003260 [Blastosporella zonata]|nr:hypothetical protein C0991_003260 [Blastosporella zonata]
MTSLTSVTTITPTLINQVNSAASSNPTLANLLQLAAAGHASPEQLKTLGLLIQSLATSEATQPIPPSLPASSSLPPLPILPSTPAATVSVAPVKEFDLVLEFRENPIDRWIFPRGVVTCERTIDLPATHALSRTVIKACLPFSKPKISVSTASEQPHPVNSLDEVPQVAIFTLERTPLAVWDTISRWVGSPEKLQLNKTKLEGIKPIEYVYLGYQLSQGPLLSQLQIASSPMFTMKSLKVAAATANRAKRKVTQKPPKTTQDQATHHPQNPATTEKASSAKRRRVIHQTERTPAPPIQCVSCKNKDVPLILGGRFCRPCVEAGRTAPVTQLAQPYRFSPYNPPTSIPSMSTIPASTAKPPAPPLDTLK